MRPPLFDPTGAPIGRHLSPDPLRGIRRVFGTRGVPSIRHGSDGDLATDPTTGKLYVRSASGWAFKGQGFQRLFQPSSGDVFSYGQGDPVDITGHVYGLTMLTTDPTNGSSLSWTYPVQNGISPTVSKTTRIYLQRSPTLTTHPLGGGTYWALTTVWVPADGPPADGDWTTIQTWEDNYTGWDDATLPSSYVDSAVPNHIYNYRIVLFTPTITSEVFGEIDWNVVTSTKHWNVHVTVGPLINGQNQAVVSWS